MEKKEAQRYSLLKNFDFGRYLTNKGGEGILLIPKGDSYISKNYGYGLLSLVPFLQESFNKNRSITINELIRELEEEGEILLVPDEIDEMERQTPFLYTTLNMFKKHEIVKFDRKIDYGKDIALMDKISKGKNYDKARVFMMTNPFEDSFETFLEGASKPEKRKTKISRGGGGGGGGGG